MNILFALTLTVYTYPTLLLKSSNCKTEVSYTHQGCIYLIKTVIL